MKLTGYHINMIVKVKIAKYERSGGRNRYCVIKEIEGKKVWGIWQNSIVEAVQKFIESPNLSKWVISGNKYIDVAKTNCIIKEITI